MLSGRSGSVCGGEKEERKGERRTGEGGRGFMKEEKKNEVRVCRALAKGAYDFSFPRRAVKIARVQSPRTLFPANSRGRITAIIIRLMPCKLSGRERPFAWFYAHFSADA